MDETTEKPKTRFYLVPLLATIEIMVRIPSNVSPQDATIKALAGLGDWRTPELNRQQLIPNTIPHPIITAALDTTESMNPKYGDRILREPRPAAQRRRRTTFSEQIMDADGRLIPYDGPQAPIAPDTSPDFVMTPDDEPEPEEEPEEGEMENTYDVGN